MYLNWIKIIAWNDWLILKKRLHSESCGAMLSYFSVILLHSDWRESQIHIHQVTTNLNMFLMQEYISVHYILVISFQTLKGNGDFCSKLHNRAFGWREDLFSPALKWLSDYLKLQLFRKLLSFLCTYLEIQLLPLWNSIQYTVGVCTLQYQYQSYYSYAHSKFLPHINMSQVFSSLVRAVFQELLLYHVLHCRSDSEDFCMSNRNNMLVHCWLWHGYVMVIRLLKIETCAILHFNIFLIRCTSQFFSYFFSVDAVFTCLLLYMVPASDSATPS